MRRSALTLTAAFAALLIGASSALAQIPGGGAAGGGAAGGGAAGAGKGGGSGSGPGGNQGGSQGGGSNAGAAGMPSKEEIEKKIKEQFDALPERVAELGRVKITYKPIPTNPIDIVQGLGPLPQGMKPEQAVKQFMPLARPYIDKYMAEVGKLITDVDLKTKAGKLAPAEYTFGLVMDELRPVAIRLTGKSLKSPMTLPLKGTAAQSPFASLLVELKESKKEDEFGIDVGWDKVLGQPAKIQILKAK
jgi:hypothetical protein